MKNFTIEQYKTFSKILNTIEHEFADVKDPELDEVKEKAAADLKKFGDDIVTTYIKALEDDKYIDDDYHKCAHEYLALGYFEFTCGTLGESKEKIANGLSAAVDAFYATQKEVEFAYTAFGSVHNEKVQQFVKGKTLAHNNAKKALIGSYILALEAKCIIPDGYKELVADNL